VLTRQYRPKCVSTFGVPVCQEDLLGTITGFSLVVIEGWRTDGAHSAKYLLLIAYLTGLSAGVHLMSVLAIAAVVFLVVITAYVRNDEACKKSGFVLLGHIAVMAAAGALLWSGQTATRPPSARGVSIIHSAHGGLMKQTGAGRPGYRLQ
jgi:hypothetical protein